MTQPVVRDKPVTLEGAWWRLMWNMGHVNLQRSRDAGKAARAIGAFRRGK